MFEQIEDEKEDHNILAVRTGQRFEVTTQVGNTLREFVLNVFVDVPGKSICVARLLPHDRYSIDRRPGHNMDGHQQAT